MGSSEHPITPQNPEAERRLIEDARAEAHDPAESAATVAASTGMIEGLLQPPTVAASSYAGDAGLGRHRSPPMSIPDYDLLRSLGRGGFGEVWLARQKLTGVFYAVKVIPRDRLGAMELQGVRNYKQRTAGHPHLINLEHVGETDECYYYVMELADDARGTGLHDPAGYQATTLAEYLQRKGPRPVAEAVAIAGDLLHALEHLHDAGLLHRDVKPANVMLRDGRWKLGDIGLVTTHDETGTQARTPAYSPSEGVCDRSGDLFCLGRVLYEIVSGGPPKDCLAIPQHADAAQRAALTSLRPILERACACPPADRFQTADEFTRALEEIVGPAVTSRPGLDRTRAGRRTKVAPALLGGLALLAVAGTLLWKPWFAASPTPRTATI